MYTKKQLNDLYERVVKDIDISDSLFDAAEQEYMALGLWIDRQTPTYKVSIYPQGSFALGTVNKPVKGTDDYDLDLVCEFEEQYGLSARVLKRSVVKPLLERYRQTKGEIEEKRRCWHVEYVDVPKFHMDVIPAVYRGSYIDITDHDEENDCYEYIGSNPKGYVKWFQDCMSVRRRALRDQYCQAHRDVIKSQADIETLKEYHYKTPLQKAIQILKRHRDVMFDGDTNHVKPISIIITTIAAELYNNEDNIVDTLVSILTKAEGYIWAHKIGDEFHVDNPSYTGGDTENFADKWNEYPERAAAFFRWLAKARADLIDTKLYGFARVQMADNIKKSLGEVTQNRVFAQMAEEERLAIAAQQRKVDPKTGSITESGSISIPRSHHYGA